MGGTADHISGLEVAGNTLAITLTAPSTNFLERLTSPYVCPVPVDTPAVAGSSGVAIPTGQATNEFVVPSDGPYYIAQHADGEYTVLLRNPNYTGSRAHIFDAIVLRGGINVEQARAFVASGEWDGIVHIVDRENHVTAEAATPSVALSIRRRARDSISP